MRCGGRVRLTSKFWVRRCGRNCAARSAVPPLATRAQRPLRESDPPLISRFLWLGAVCVPHAGVLIVMWRRYRGAALYAYASID